jgi:cytochrome c oxidase cbb3-type subunit 3
MTTFWSLYVTVLSLGTIFSLTWLLLSTRKGQRSEQTDETVGHSFDGIEEYDNPLPKWWFMLFVGTIVFALGYLVLYPGLGNWKGLLLPGYNYLDNDKQTAFANGQTGWTGVHEWENGQLGRQVRSDLRQVRGDANRRSRQGPASTEDGRPPVRLQLLGVPRLRRQGRLWLPEPDRRRLALGRRAGNHQDHHHGRSSRGDAGLGRRHWRARRRRRRRLRGDQLDGRKLPEGTKADPANGQKLFAANCVACHGPEGKGTPAMGAPT